MTSITCHCRQGKQPGLFAPHNRPLQTDERLRGSHEVGPAPRRRGVRPHLLAAVIRSDHRSAFATERQIVSRTQCTMAELRTEAYGPQGDASHHLPLTRGARGGLRALPEPPKDFDR